MPTNVTIWTVFSRARGQARTPMASHLMKTKKSFPYRSKVPLHENIIWPLGCPTRFLFFSSRSILAFFGYRKSNIPGVLNLFGAWVHNLNSFAGLETVRSYIYALLCPSLPYAFVSSSCQDCRGVEENARQTSCVELKCRAGSERMSRPMSSVLPLHHRLMSNSTDGSKSFIPGRTMF